MQPIAIYNIIFYFSVIHFENLTNYIKGEQPIEDLKMET